MNRIVNNYEAFLSIDTLKHVKFDEAINLISYEDQESVKSDESENDPNMDAYLANVLAESTDDDMDEEHMDLEALRKKRASKELDSIDLAEFNEPEIHTYQEIIEIVEYETAADWDMKLFEFLTFSN